MRVIILNDFAYVNGGASQIAIYTAKKMAEEGIDTCLFTGEGPIDKDIKNKKNLKIICLNQYDILTDPNRLRAIIQGIWNYKAKKVFKDLLLSEYDKNDTVIHVHTCQKVLSSSCIKIAKKLGYKIIYHMHDYGIACPNLGFYNYKKRCICEKKAMSIACLKENCDSRKYFHKLWRVCRHYVQENIVSMSKNIDCFIAVSDFSLNILKEYLPTNKKIKVLPNPIDIKYNKKIDVVKNKKIIYIGRLSPEKNPVLLAKCAKDLKISVIFIGDGICKKEIKKINPNAEVTGWISKNEMEKYLIEARALVMTSLWYETQGLVALEAAAYGIPVIAPNTCAITDFIEDNKNGLIFKSNNEFSLRNKIVEILDNKRAQKLSNNSYNYYLKYSEISKCYIANLLELYSSIIVKNHMEKDLYDVNKCNN